MSSDISNGNMLRSTSGCRSFCLPCFYTNFYCKSFLLLYLDDCSVMSLPILPECSVGFKLNMTKWPKKRLLAFSDYTKCYLWLGHPECKSMLIHDVLQKINEFHSISRKIWNIIQNLTS
ncbi:hypothetical protein O6H91_03G046500 [Diphasiastrum complanatum]|uniref:Uncharacterized protein n=1 Tax=Diphasiastrum complanatum TaxID=34168 RepID=A0ACC2E5S0_DIPCM|nr:hypothetical protein O6H91_03G046500 [Diphasiastrum complanatum]